MEDIDVESPSSRSNGLSHILSKSRSRTKKHRDSSSLKSLDSDQRIPRASTGEVTRHKTATDQVADHGTLKKLLPRALNPKRRQKEQEEVEREEAARGRKIADRGLLRTDDGGTRLGTPDADAQEESSELADESDLESSNDIRPPLSSHGSHAGYLTTSSPLVHATTIQTEPAIESHVDGAAHSRTLAKESHHGAGLGIDSVTTSHLRSPPGDSRRSVSPVGKLKDALTPRWTNTKEKGFERATPNLGPGFGGTDPDTASSAATGGATTYTQSVADVGRSPVTGAPERPTPAKIEPINTSPRPQTPPSGDSTPVIVNTPPTPTLDSEESLPPGFAQRQNPNVVTSPSGNMISHRRVKSGPPQSVGPSKLSSITNASLAPTPEHAQATASTGFFSTVFSAAQNAATTLSNSMGSTSSTTSKSKTGILESREVEEPKVESFTDKMNSNDPVQEKELAIKTLGSGDLSLSHLGLSDANSSAATPVSGKFPKFNGNNSANGEASVRNSSSTGAAGTEEAVPVDDVQAVVKPRPIYDATPHIGSQTPPSSVFADAKDNLQRNSSIRSAVTRRHRNSSTTTGTTIAAAIAAANASVAQPNSGPKITGFAVASKKRNRDFHNLFKSVPDDDYLIEDYSCALQREILAHGRLYVSEGHMCFSSNIFGWVTTLVMSFDEIVSVEKRSTALVFKNGLMISTLHAKHIFASFTSRDSTYDLIVGIWKLGHPSLQSSLNGIPLDETGGDKTEKAETGTKDNASDSASDEDSEDGDEIYDEDEDDGDETSVLNAGGSMAGSEAPDKPHTRKPSANIVITGITDKKEDGLTAQIVDFPGPLTHAPTDCPDPENHYSKVIADDIIPAPLGKVYNLMFGPASVTWMRNWLVAEQKSLDLTMDEDKYLSNDSKVRSYSYIKPLNGAIGPRQTKCLSTETLDFMDLERAVTVTIATQTPDVPSGNVFSTKTKYCLSWAEGAATRLQMNCTIEWTGKSWIKGPIEKGAGDGQSAYAKSLVACLKAAVSSRRSINHPSGSKSRKKGRKGKESRNLTKTAEASLDSKAEAANWGIFEPIRGMLEPLFDIIQPLVGGNIKYLLFGFLLIATWFRFGIFDRGIHPAHDAAVALSMFGGHPARLAAYEELWRKEQSDLWDWLEDRTRLDQAVGIKESSKGVLAQKLKDETLGARDIGEAIKVTEEKLGVLKQLMARKDGDQSTGREDL